MGATSGETTFTWAGVDNNGNPVEAGNYTVQVELEDGDGNAFPVPTFQKRRVDGISYKNGSILVLVDGRELPIESVIEVYEPPEEQPTGQFKNGKGYTPQHPSLIQQALAAYGEPQSGVMAPMHQAYKPFTVIPGGRQ